MAEGAWVPLYQSIRRHPRTMMFRAVTGKNEWEALGILTALFLWAVDCPDGILPPDARAIALGIGYEDDPEVLLRGLRKSYLIELEDEEGNLDGYAVHDWEDYVGQLIAQRAANRDRQRAWRARARQSQDSPEPPSPTLAGAARNRYVTVTHNTEALAANAESGDMRDRNALTQPEDNRVDNTTEDNPEPPPLIPPKGGEGVRGSGGESKRPRLSDPRIDEAYSHYKTRIQPDARVCPREKIATRLKRYTVDELKTGIDHFAADQWWMDHNSARGASWFFHSDARSEQFLHMRPRVVSMRPSVVDVDIGEPTSPQPVSGAS